MLQLSIHIVLDILIVDTRAEQAARPKKKTKEEEPIDRIQEAANLREMDWRPGASLETNRAIASGRHREPQAYKINNNDNYYNRSVDFCVDFRF